MHLSRHNTLFCKPENEFRFFQVIFSTLLLQFSPKFNLSRSPSLDMPTGKNQRKRQQRRPRRRAPSSSAPTLYRPSRSQLTLRGPGVIVPDRYTAKLVYFDDQIQRTQSTALYTNWRFRTNGAFDVDPALASGSLTGFGELMTLYTSFRVHAFSFQWDVTNNETFPLVVGHFPSQQDLGGNFTGFLGFLEQSRAQSKILSAKGGSDRAQFKQRYTLAAFKGDISPETDITYVGNASGNPTTLMYHNWGCYSGTGASLTASGGISCMLRVWMEVEFFGRRTFSTG